MATLSLNSLFATLTESIQQHSCRSTPVASRPGTASSAGSASVGTSSSSLSDNRRFFVKRVRTVKSSSIGLRDFVWSVQIAQVLVIARCAMSVSGGYSD